MVVVYIDWKQDTIIQMKQIADSGNRIIKKEEETKIPILSNFNDFPKIVYMLVALSMILYSGVFPFNYIATGFLISTWYNNIPNVDAQHKAGILMGLPFLISAFTVPIIGKTKII